MSETEKERTLLCVTDGRVVSVSELRERTAGGGFAVIPSGNAAARLYRRLTGRKELPALAPADGVVTKREGGRLTLRTADGLELAVDLGEGAQVKAQVGERVLCGERIGVLGEGGRAVVLFPDTTRVTEFHVFAGRRRRGAAAAFYRVIQA